MIVEARPKGRAFHLSARVQEGTITEPDEACNSEIEPIWIFDKKFRQATREAEATKQRHRTDLPIEVNLPS